MVKKYPKKRVKAYAFRQFQRTVEQERKLYEIKSGKQKEVILEGYGRIREQVITYRKIKQSRIVYRDSKGRFVKKPSSKMLPKTPEARQTIFGDMPYHRASVYIEVPFHSNAKIGINNYYWFGIIVIDKPEKINLDNMHEELIQIIEDELHYKRGLLDWFDWKHPSIEHPKPFPASRPDKIIETWSRTKR